MMTTPEQFHLRLKHLKLRNFRNYVKLDLEIQGRLVFFTGNNGAGKTSILEALGLLSNLRSFRGASDRDMIHWNEDHYAMELLYEGPAGDSALRLGYGLTGETKKSWQRRMSSGGKRIERVGEYIGKFNTVVFSPGDLHIMEGSMGERRKYIDMVISTLNPSYLEALQNYRRALAMRSKVLGTHKGHDTSYIEAISAELAKSGAYIQKERLLFLEKFSPHFEAFVRRISAQKDSWVIRYLPSIESGASFEGYREALTKALPNDLLRRHTTRGVHRDRLMFHPAGEKRLEIKEIASQGQKRTAALALKMAQFAYTGEATHRTPVLLIDDVLNELDIQRRESFISFLNETGQSLITTTDISALKSFIEQKKKEMPVLIYELSHGENGETHIKLLE